MNPNTRPPAIKNVGGIAVIVRNAGIEQSGSCQSFSAACPSISAPTTINAGAVACGGITQNIGATNIAPANSNPLTTALTPDLLPATTPAALSI